MTKHLLCLFIFLALALPAYAQNSAPQSELQRALEEIKKEPPPEQQKTAKTLANDHFMACLSQSRPRYTAEIHEYICGCAAAKIADYLSVDEIELLTKETKRGDDARAKYLINVYSPCIKDITTELGQTICKDSDFLKKNIVSGKRKVCDCIVTGMKQYLKSSETRIFMESTLINPLTLDPLHDKMGTDDFKRTESGFIMNCYNAMIDRN